MVPSHETYPLKQVFKSQYGNVMYSMVLRVSRTYSSGISFSRWRESHLPTEASPATLSKIIDPYPHSTNSQTLPMAPFSPANLSLHAMVHLSHIYLVYYLSLPTVLQAPLGSFLGLFWILGAHHHTGHRVVSQQGVAESKDRHPTTCISNVQKNLKSQPLLRSLSLNKDLLYYKFYYEFQRDRAQL